MSCIEMQLNAGIDPVYRRAERAGDEAIEAAREKVRHWRELYPQGSHCVWRPDYRKRNPETGRQAVAQSAEINDSEPSDNKSATPVSNESEDAPTGPPEALGGRHARRAHAQYRMMVDIVMQISAMSEGLGRLKLPAISAMCEEKNKELGEWADRARTAAEALERFADALKQADA